MLGGVGSGYRIAPSGTPLSLPVTLTFTPPAGTSPAGLTAAYQAAVGYWVRVYTVTRDATTVSTVTTALLAWSLVNVATQRDLIGPFRLDSTKGLPNTANRNATLQFLGDDGSFVVYLPQGTITPAVPIPKGTATCTPVSPDDAA